MEIQAGIRLKHVLVLMAIAFAVTLAVMVGKEMSAEAMAVVIGVVCGVLAAVPTTVLLMLVLARGGPLAGRDGRTGQESGRSQQGQPGAYPPVVVIQGGAPQARALPPGMGDYWPGATMGTVDSRDFRVVGGDDLLEGGPYRGAR